MATIKEMEGQKESVMIPFDQYRDKDGEPTCAINFNTNEVCAFYRTQSFGTRETCVFAPSLGDKKQTLNRRGEQSLGTLIPGDFCILFRKE